MDVAGREDLHYLVQHIEEELIGLRIAGAVFARTVSLALAAKLGMGDEDGIRMGRKFDLRDYLYVPVCSVGYYFAQLVFGVISAVGTGSPFVEVALVLLVPPFYPAFLCAEGPFAGQLRIAVEQDSPSSVVGQMQMEIVHLVGGHHIEHTEDFLFREEVS